MSIKFIFFVSFQLLFLLICATKHTLTYMHFVQRYMLIFYTIVFPTLISRCEFSRAHCTDNTLDLLHSGACTDADKPTASPVDGVDVVFDFMCTSLSHMACPADDSKVCATDGRTYSS